MSFDLMDEAFAKMPVQKQLRREREDREGDPGPGLKHIPTPVDLDHPLITQFRLPLPECP